MSGPKSTIANAGSDHAALRDEELDTATGGAAPATQAATDGSDAPVGRGVRVGDPNDPKQVAAGLK